MANVVGVQYERTGKSLDIDNLGMREMQRRAYSVRENRYIKIEAITTNNLSKKRGRVEYKRGYFSQVNNENLVSVSGQQGSNILTSLSNANCYIRLDSNVSKVKKGDKVTVIPFDIKI